MPKGSQSRVPALQGHLVSDCHQGPQTDGLHHMPDIRLQPNLLTQRTSKSLDLQGAAIVRPLSAPIHTTSNTVPTNNMETL